MSSSSGRRDVAASRRRLQSSYRSRNIVVSRPPILIEFNSTMVKAGHAGQPKAHSILSMLPIPLDSDTNNDAAEYYRHYAPVITQVLSFCQDLAERKALVIVNGLYLKRAMVQALERLLYSNGCKAVTVLPAIELIPYSLPSLDSMLVIHFEQTTQTTTTTNNNGGSLVQAHLLAHAHGRPLEYTHQAVSTTMNTTTGNDENPTKHNWVSSVYSADSLVLAILQCIQACPRQVRTRVIHNLVFCGDVYPSTLPVQVAKLVQSTLMGQCEQEELENIPPSVTEYSNYTREPLSTELSSLASHVGIVQIPQIRPELYAWMGASAWAAYWHNKDPDNERFQWKQNNTLKVKD
jgi:hypothetical protein